jgi:phenylalanyl-tRNA synthetase beta chain
MLAAWLPPSSTVPETFGDVEPFVLSAKNLRGTVSNGMLASAKELDLFDDHTGILEIDKEVVPGSSFATLYELDDYLLDIENKSLTHRPDTFGVIGFAREIAGIQGHSFTTPEWLIDVNPHIDHDGSAETPHVSIDDPTLSDRFQAIILTGADEGAQSPVQMQTYLARSGIRPISAVVDVTNYLMLLAGRPLHAYDYDKVLTVSGGKNDIHVRCARPGETLALLDGRVLELAGDDIVVAAGETAIGLGGAMGGRDTEIDNTTTRILLECATFDLYRLRNMQMRHGIFTEAITRLTKGLPGALGAPVLAEAVRMMGELAGARPASAVGDAYPGKRAVNTVNVSISDINNVLGSELTVHDAAASLSNVELGVDVHNDTLSVTVPYWRNDIHIREDLIEEVGRLRGFDTIRPTLPTRDFTAVSPDAFDRLRTRLRSLLVRAGANELLTYSFVHGDMMKKVGQSPDEAYRIVNSISPELQYYRQSIVPSLLGNIHPNIKAGFDQFAVFEINKFHTKRHDLTEEGVPREFDSLGFVIAAKKSQDGSAYYGAKQYLDFVADNLGLNFTYTPLESDSDYPVTQPFEPKRSARASDSKTGERIGVIGEFRSSVVKNFKLPEYSAGFEISPRALLKLTTDQESAYRPLSKYPWTERDICFQVSTDVTYGDVIAAVQSALTSSYMQTVISPVDIYRPDSSQAKNITIRISFVADDHTLTGDEVAAEMSRIVDTVVTALHATVI